MLTVTFEPTTPEQAAVVAQAIAAYLKASAEEPTTVDEPAPKARKARAATPPAAETAPADPAQPEPASESRSEPITLERVREKLSAIALSGKKDQVVSLLRSFGAKGVSEVDPGKYAELLKAAEGL